MAKSSSSAAASASSKQLPTNAGVPVKAIAKNKRPRPVVQVVTCGSAFPISTKPKRSDRDSQADDATKSGADKTKSAESDLLDWHDTVKQVRSIGMNGMVGQQKRNHVDDEYKRLTGRDKKKHQVPLPIVRGIKKKAAQRQARLLQEAKEAGIVMPTKSSTTAAEKREMERQKDSTNRVHGPAPSIGFMKKGVFRVPKKR